MRTLRLDDSQQLMYNLQIMAQDTCVISNITFKVKENESISVSKNCSHSKSRRCNLRIGVMMELITKASTTQK